MKIKYEVTIEDLEEFSVFFMVNNKFGRQRYVVGRYLMGVASFLLLFVFWGYNFPYALWSYPIYFGGAILLSFGIVLGYSWLMKWGTKEAVRRMHSGDYVKGFVGWHERTLTEKGIESTSEVANGFISWEGIKAVHFAETCLYIWLGPTIAWVIPKEGVTGGDYDTFKEELKRLFEKNRPRMKVETYA